MEDKYDVTYILRQLNPATAVGLVHHHAEDKGKYVKRQSESGGGRKTRTQEGWRWRINE